MFTLNKNCHLEGKIVYLCWGFFPNTCPIRPFFFFLLPLCFEFSLEYWCIYLGTMLSIFICFIYFGELPNMQHLYRENLILTSFLISLCLFFLFAWCFHFAAGRNTDFWGCVFSEVEVL